MFVQVSKTAGSSAAEIEVAALGYTSLAMMPELTRHREQSGTKVWCWTHERARIITSNLGVGWMAN